MTSMHVSMVAFSPRPGWVCHVKGEIEVGQQCSSSECSAPGNGLHMWSPTLWRRGTGYGEKTKQIFHETICRGLRSITFNIRCLHHTPSVSEVYATRGKWSMNHLDLNSSTFKHRPRNQLVVSWNRHSCSCHQILGNSSFCQSQEGWDIGTSHGSFLAYMQ